MKKFGLIGYPLVHSFSKQYYTEKFENLGLSDHSYELFPLQALSELPQLLKDEPKLCGLNVTIPHKIGVLYYLDWVSPEAKVVNAVNCIKILKRDPLEDLFSGECSLERVRLHGYNTDVYGFEESLKPVFNKSHTRAMVLGNGGAATAVLYLLRKLHIEYTVVSGKASHIQLPYEEIRKETIEKHSIIINTTPVGTYPNVNECLDIPYEYIGKQHLLYDLIYNLVETEFLRMGRLIGATNIICKVMLKYHTE